MSKENEVLFAIVVLVVFSVLMVVALVDGVRTSKETGLTGERPDRVSFK